MDDEQPILTAMGAYLRHHGYQVDSARDRGTAESHLAASDYAVVIVDLRLGSTTDQIEGLNIIQGLRGRSTRSIVLTAYGSSEIEARAYACGADAFLHKPQQLARIAALIAKLTRGESTSARRSP